MEYLACAKPLRRAGLSAAAETLVNIDEKESSDVNRGQPLIGFTFSWLTAEAVVAASQVSK